MYQTKELPCNETPNDCHFVLKAYKAGELIHHANQETNYLIFCRQGTVRITSSSFSEEMLYAGELLFLPSMIDCRYEIQSDTCIIIHAFNNTVCRPENCILAYLYSHRNKISAPAQIHYCCKLAAMPSLLVFMESVRHYLEDRTGDRTIWLLKHKELIRLFCRYYNVEELQSFFHPIIGVNVPFRSLVLAHYAHTHNVEELATRCGYGLCTFRRFFKKEFGVPVYHWLLQKRIEQIRNRLSLHYIPFCDIIEEFNIKSPQQFNRFCKKHLHDTPTNLRNKNK